MRGIKSLVLTGNIVVEQGRYESGEQYSYGYVVQEPHLHLGLTEGDGDLRAVLAELAADGWVGVRVTFERDRNWRLDQ